MPGTGLRTMAAERRRFRGTIRLRITMVAVLAVALVLLTTSVVLVLVQRAQLTAGLDTRLEQRADDLGRLPR